MSVMVMGLALNWVAAAVLALTIAFYVFVYTIWLKRRTPQNIVIGGAAGAFPPVAGWAAVTGDVSLAPIALFLIIFVWTPPHFWALSLDRCQDYARVGVPMLPVVAGAEKTRQHILAYALALLPVSLLPWWLGLASGLYALAALALGGGFVQLRLQAVARSRHSAPRMRTFRYSIVYLFGVFLALMLDKALPCLVAGYGDGARPERPPARQEHRAGLDPGGARGAVLPDHHRQDERRRHMSARRPERAKALTALALASVIVGMLGLTAAAVPLYRLFCQATGYGGTTQRAEAAPGQQSERTIKVRFNADVAQDLPWTFRAGGARGRGAARRAAPGVLPRAQRQRPADRRHGDVQRHAVQGGPVFRQDRLLLLRGADPAGGRDASTCRCRSTSIRRSWTIPRPRTCARSPCPIRSSSLTGAAPARRRPARSTDRPHEPHARTDVTERVTRAT